MNARHFLLTAFTLPACLGPALASPAAPDIRAELDSFTAHYFRNPQPLGIDKLLYYSAKLDPEAREADHARLRLFFGEVFRRHRNHLMGWEAAVASLPYEWQKLLEWSIRFAHGDEPNPIDSPQPTAEALSACMGGFMATGHGKYVQHLLRVACAPGEGALPEQAARLLEGGIRDYEEIRKMLRHAFSQAGDAPKQAFARRMNEAAQQAVLGEVLHAQEPNH